MITLKNIVKNYGNKTVLNDICLNIEKGDYISIAGQSGAGKSTLMHIIGTLDIEFKGEYIFEGSPLNKKTLNEFRNANIGFLFQQYNLIPNLTVLENILMPYVFHCKKIKDIDARADELLLQFRMSDNKKQLVNTLSGGEQQRIALVRSILLDPPIIIADEPTGNLDKGNSRIIRDFLKNMNENGKTVIVVTHDMEFAKEAKKEYIIENGKLNERL